MKKIFFYLIVIVFYQCQAQEKLTYNNVSMNIIDSSSEKFDFSFLKKSDQVYDKPEHFSYESQEVIKTDGTIELISGNYWEGKIKIIPKKSWFNIVKIFHDNGNIYLKGIENKTSLGDYGKLYEFDKQGKLVKTTNFEKDWKTSFIRITGIANKYAKKFNYKVDTSEDGIITSKDKQQWDKEYVKIWRKEEADKKFWFIGFNKGHYENSDDKKVERVVIVIDDVTGKEIKKLHYFDWYNRNFKELDEN